MRFLIGTLYSGENEFERSCESIRNQSLPALEHKIISGLSAGDAHRELFHYFMANSGRFDLLLKVDADMVLSRPTLLAEVSAIFLAKPQLHHYQIAVQDWYTDRLILGMNVYRNTVLWDFDGSIFVENSKILRLSVDGVLCALPSGASIRDRNVLAPAAFHCPDPSPSQAFHFGLHKGVKVVEAADNGWLQRLNEHSENIDLVYRHFLRNRDRRLLLAAVGGELAVVKRLSTRYASYTEDEVVSLLDRFCRLSDQELCQALEELQWTRRAMTTSMPEYCLQRAGGWRSLITSSRLYRLCKRLLKGT